LFLRVEALPRKFVFRVALAQAGEEAGSSGCVKFGASDFDNGFRPLGPWGMRSVALLRMKVDARRIQAVK